jgi:hypothetical protein
MATELTKYTRVSDDVDVDRLVQMYSTDAETAAAELPRTNSKRMDTGVDVGVDRVVQPIQLMHPRNRRLKMPIRRQAMATEDVTDTKRKAAERAEKNAIRRL